MKELFDIIYIQKMLYYKDNVYYMKDEDLSVLFNIDIKKIIKKNKLLKYSSIKINKNYYLDNNCILYIVYILNTNKALITYNKIINAYNLVKKYKKINSY